MKNRINFYRPAFQPRLVLLSAGFSTTLVALALLITVGWTAYAYQQRALSQQQALQGADSLAQARTTLEKLTQTLQQRKPDPVLVAKNRALSEQNRMYRKIVSALQAREQQKQRGFSPLLSDLARLHHQDIALTRIQLGADFIQLEGHSASSSAVPAWVENLKHSDVLYGTGFAQARLQRDEDQASLGFVLTSASHADTEEVRRGQ
ncbi:PilN domain-containing protein [Aestuariibacter halophilus]|uniref:PilN domain-containing protein n=1 Tax=Fluctibacter halophilus TaxID=226011 RepID=A0ABS8GAU6_9ALTE|nr:PilN domain-containing protein [Aestuariibacter halophilus]MCC2617633.1 PilN domain-containing protein [Aestuariibacter halophilus]